MTESKREKVPAILVEETARYVEAFNRGDAAGVAAFLAENCTYCTSAGGLFVGRAAVQAALQSYMTAGVKIKFEVVEGEMYGDRAHWVQHAEVTGPDGQVISSGNTLCLGMLKHGNWQTTHIWEIVTPAPGK